MSATPDAPETAADVPPADADELFPAAEIEAGFDRLAADLQPLISQGDCILLAVMTGGMFPLMQLASRLTGNFLLDYCHVTRYAGATAGGKLEWLATPRMELAGKTVIVIDDIFDAGTTLEAVAAFCREAGAAAVQTAVMVEKRRTRSPDMPQPDFSTGLEVPDRYVFGCGMDLHEQWRHLPSIYALRTKE